MDGRRIPSLLYRIEESRGYESTGDLWSPGHFRVDLRNGGYIEIDGVKFNESGRFTREGFPAAQI